MSSHADGGRAVELLFFLVVDGGITRSPMNFRVRVHFAAVCSGICAASHEQTRKIFTILHAG